jgi:hypothetical protein
MDWKPATMDEVKDILKAELKECNSEQLANFRQHAIEPHFAPIVRYGITGNVVVVARKSDEVIYWEDIEEGFNISLVSPDGRVLEHWCNKDELGVALDRLIQSREHRTDNFGTAKPIDSL